MVTVKVAFSLAGATKDLEFGTGGFERPDVPTYLFFLPERFCGGPLIHYAGCK